MGSMEINPSSNTGQQPLVSFYPLSERLADPIPSPSPAAAPPLADNLTATLNSLYTEAFGDTEPQTLKDEFKQAPQFGTSDARFAAQEAADFLTRHEVTV